MIAPLSYKLFVTQQIPQSGRGPLPDGSTRMWSPMTSTLIVGSEEAVLVDPPLTNAQTAEVGDWIESYGHRLTRIYVTHGHGDHWFGAIPLLERFPDAVVNATKGTTAHMAAQNAPSSGVSSGMSSSRTNCHTGRSTSTSWMRTVSSWRE